MSIFALIAVVITFFAEFWFSEAHDDDNIRMIIVKNESDVLFMAMMIWKKLLNVLFTSILAYCKYINKIRNNKIKWCKIAMKAIFFE